MKSPLPRLGLVLLLASSFMAQANIDQIPYYIAGEAANEFLAKPMGKWFVLEQLGMNKTKAITSVAGQDFKFVIASGLQGILSAGLPALNQQASARTRALASIAEEAIDRTTTPGPLTQTTLRPQLSAADLRHAARLQINVIKTPAEQASAAFKAGAKYIAISEFVEYGAKIVEEWNKVKAQQPVIRTTNGNQTTIQLDDNLPLAEDTLLNPVAWYHWILDRTQVACNRGNVFWQELWNNRALAMYVAVHIVVAYHVTRFTMVTSRMFREMTFVNRGYELFKMDPFKQVFETTMGVFLSMFIKPFITMPLLAQAGEQFGFNVTSTNKLVDAAYLAGIKGPFACDALYDTYAAGTVPLAMLASFFTMDRMYPYIRQLVSGTVFTIQLGWAYYVTRHPQIQAQHAHAH